MKFLSLFLSLVMFSPIPVYAVDTDIDGTVMHSVRDYFKENRHTEHFHVRDKVSGKLIELKFKKGKKPNLRHGYKIRAKGKKNSQDFDVENIEVVGTEVPSGQVNSLISAATVPVTTKKAVVLLVNLKNANSAYTAAGIISQLYTSVNSVSKRFARQSFGHLNLVGDADNDGTNDVLGPYTVNYTAPNCDADGWAREADAAAKAAGVDLSKYTNRIYAVPSYSALGCGWAGTAYVGCGSYCQTWFAYNTPSLATHELGHNFGMGHASTDPGDDNTTDGEYADYSDEMGSPYANRNFNAPHLHHMGWMNSHAGVYKDITTSGRYEIQAIDTNPEAAIHPFTLRIPRVSGGHYYLSLRKAEGEDAGISVNNTVGVNIHYHRGSSNNTNLIRVLSDGQSFTNAAGGNFTVTQIGAPVNGVVSVDIKYAPINDTTPPTVSLTSPANGATITGALNFAANASDNVGVYYVGFYVDGGSYSSDTTAPYTYSIPDVSQRIKNGPRVLKAIAYDYAGNKSESSITVNVNAVDTTPPSAGFVSPVNGANITGVVNVQPYANDFVGVSSITLDIDGVAFGTDTTYPYSFSVDTNKLSNGAHTFKAIAKDAAGNIGQASVSVNVNNTGDNTQPTVSITSPANSANINGVTNIDVSASDNIGVSAVELKVDGVSKGSDTSAPYSFSLDTKTLSNGAHTIAAIAKDAAGNSKEASISVTVNNPDITLPVVSISSPANGASVNGVVSIAVSASDNIGVSSVELKVDGVSKGSDSLAPYSFSLDTKTLSNGAHTIAAVAKDAAGNSKEASISVTVNNPDITLPVVSITSPANGASVNGVINVDVSASDNIGVSSVELKVDGAAFSTDSTAPYSFSLDTKTLSNGAHTIAAIAKDAAGNSKEASISVTVNNPDITLPVVSITSPANGANINGVVSIAVNASDNIGVSSVELKVDGVAYGSDSSAPYSFSLDTKTLSNGAHTIAAIAKDAAGNSKETSISVTVNNPDVTLPVVSITSPANGASVNGVVSIAVNASDNIGVSAVELKVDGAAYGSDSSAPYSFSIDTKNLSNGAHTIAVIARDAAGNSKEASISVTVNNPDVTLPVVSITSPANGANINGVVSIAVNASDNIGVSNVELKVDGASNGSDSSAPYSFSLDTKTLSNGAHTIAAIARDAAGNAQQASISVNVNNVKVVPVTLTSISPNSMRTGRTIIVTVIGTGFDAGTKLSFANGSGTAPSVSNILINSSGTRLTATLSLKKNRNLRFSQRWDVVVTNSTGGSKSMIKAFTVKR